MASFGVGPNPYEGETNESDPVEYSNPHQIVSEIRKADQEIRSWQKRRAILVDRYQNMMQDYERAYHEVMNAGEEVANYDSEVAIAPRRY